MNEWGIMDYEAEGVKSMHFRVIKSLLNMIHLDEEIARRRRNEMNKIGW